MFASEKWYNIELAWYEWEGFRAALKKEAENVARTWAEKYGEKTRVRKIQATK